MTELSDRQRAAIEMLETAAQTAHDIVHLPADEVVEPAQGVEVGGVGVHGGQDAARARGCRVAPVLRERA